MGTYVLVHGAWHNAGFAVSKSASLINASRQIGNGSTTEPSPRWAAMFSNSST
jgi:hypothetical protein